MAVAMADNCHGCLAPPSIANIQTNQRHKTFSAEVCAIFAGSLCVLRSSPCSSRCADLNVFFPFVFGVSSRQIQKARRERLRHIQLTINPSQEAEALTYMGSYNYLW